MKLCIIISACKAGLSDAMNLGRTALLHDELSKEKRIFQRVQGCYKGIKEDSFFITLDPTRDIDINNVYDYIAEKIEKYDQECVMLVLNKGDSYLINRDHSHVFIGKLVTSICKPNTDAYTFDPELELYYFTDNGMN